MSSEFNPPSTSSALEPFLPIDKPFGDGIEVIRNEELEKLFAQHHLGDAVFIEGQTSVQGNLTGPLKLHIGPFVFELSVTKDHDKYKIKGTLYVNVIFRKIKLFSVEFEISIPKPRWCKSFNIIGIARGTICFVLIGTCIWLEYDLRTVVGHWHGKIKVICL